MRSYFHVFPFMILQRILPVAYVAVLRLLGWFFTKDITFFCISGDTLYQVYFVPGVSSCKLFVKPFFKLQLVWLVF